MVLINKFLMCVFNFSSNTATMVPLPLFLACYLGVTSNFPFFSDSVNWPLRISTFLAGGNCIKEIDLGFKIN